MSVPAWSSEYISGFSDIDAQHKKIFQLVNAFAEENNESISIIDLIAFLDNLWSFGQLHFNEEEKLMEENDYPLTEYHANLHKSLALSIKKRKDQLRKNELKNPFITIISLTTDRLNNHIAKDDCAFFNFCKSKENVLSSEFVGKRCEISKINNEVLGYGNIRSIENNNVIIANATKKKMPLFLNDMVKVTSFSKQFQVFIAQVFYSTTEIVKLFNATIIKTFNLREYFRIPTDKEATLWLEDESFPIIIVNMSLGGLLIESDQLLDLYGMVVVEFAVQNNSFKEQCIIMHTTKRLGAPNTYGLKFEAIDNANSSKLTTYLFNRQILIKKAVL